MEMLSKYFVIGVTLLTAVLITTSNPVMASPSPAPNHYHKRSGSPLAPVGNFDQRIQTSFGDGNNDFVEPYIGNAYSFPESPSSTNATARRGSDPNPRGKHIQTDTGNLVSTASTLDIKLARKRRVTQRILEVKLERKLKWEEIARAVGRSPVWVTACCLGEASMDEPSADKLVQFLFPHDHNHDSDDLKAILMEPPVKGQVTTDVLLQDPLIYRLHEIALVYGSTIKELVHEKFGDGIMSAIDFKMEVEKEADPEGDRVKIVMSGKYLPYKRW